MIDEQLFIRRVESANADEFAEILRTVDQDQERALRAYLGDVAFERMRNSALELSLTRAAAVAKFGSVVVLHGILGAELSENTSKIWVSVFRLALGEFLHLAMDGNGNSINPVSATGILKKYYGDLLLNLAKSWNVQFLPFDWRADIRESADKLSDSIAKWFPNPAGPHRGVHSMGGLVARSAILRHPEMWQAIAPGKLVMLGTPNYGSFAIPLLFNGINDTINTVAKIDIAHSTADLLQVAKSFFWRVADAALRFSDECGRTAVFGGDVPQSQPVPAAARRYTPVSSGAAECYRRLSHDLYCRIQPAHCERCLRLRTLETISTATR